MMMTSSSGAQQESPPVQRLTEVSSSADDKWCQYVFTVFLTLIWYASSAGDNDASMWSAWFWWFYFTSFLDLERIVNKLNPNKFFSSEITKFYKKLKMARLTAWSFVNPGDFLSRITQKAVCLDRRNFGDYLFNRWCWGWWCWCWWACSWCLWRWFHLT